MKILRMIFALVLALLMVAGPGVTAPTASAQSASAKPAAGSIPGVYVSPVYPAADASGLVQVLELYDNQVMEQISFYLGKEAPISEQGTWAGAGNNQVAVTITGQMGKQYANPMVTTYTVDGDRLVDGAFVLNKQPVVTPDDMNAGKIPAAPTTPPTSADPSGVYASPVYPAADASGMLQLLALYSNHNGELTSIYVGRDLPVVEIGTWKLAKDGAVEFTATGTIEKKYDKPSMTTFQRGGDALVDKPFVLNKLAEVTPEQMNAMTAAPAASAASPAAGPAATPIKLDHAGFGAVKVDSLAPQSTAEFSLALKAGDRVAMDLQSDGKSVQVSEFRASYGPLELTSVPEAGAYLAWAPEDGTYTVAVKNGGSQAAGFVLRVVASHAPLPTKKILTQDADGQTIPVTAGEPFQVALDTNTHEGSTWTLAPFDKAALEAVGKPAIVLLGTMPTAMSQQIFTLRGLKPGAVTLTFTNAAKGDAKPAATYQVTVDVQAAAAGQEAAPAGGEAAAGANTTTQTASVPLGGVLVVPLQGNPTTGYLWQAAVSDEQVIQQRGDSIVTPQGNLAGSPATETFVFDAVGSGAATITFTHSRPWEKDTPPAETIIVEVTVQGDTQLLGSELADKWINALHEGSKENVAALLAPAFQLMRATGEVFDAQNYLYHLPVIESYQIDNVHATRQGNLLVVSYTLATDATADGKAELGKPAPRLTIFVQMDGEWKVLAHSNFAAASQ